MLRSLSMTGTPYVEEFARDWTSCMHGYMLKNFVLDHTHTLHIVCRELDPTVDIPGLQFG